MPIPESQLETWSRIGSVAQSRDTYASVRNALLNPNSAYANQVFEVFLQGSYGNDTNIYAESDVDVVIRLDSIYRSDISAVPPLQQASFQRNFIPATYTFDEFRRGVVGQLTSAFGAGLVVSSNKAIKIKAGGSRRSADVVVCHEFRRYTQFVTGTNQDYVSGIIFPTISSGDVINYPKQHSQNCTAKHQATNGWFKPMVRMVKNMRSRLVDQGKISGDTAPSYYIEGLMYSVPNDKFGGNFSDTCINCFNWILQTDRSKLVCANMQYYLVGPANVQWSADKLNTFLNAIIQLWENW